MSRLHFDYSGLSEVLTAGGGMEGELVNSYMFILRII